MVIVRDPELGFYLLTYLLLLSLLLLRKRKKREKEGSVFPCHTCGGQRSALVLSFHLGAGDETEVMRFMWEVLLP